MDSKPSGTAEHTCKVCTECSYMLKKGVSKCSLRWSKGQILMQQQETNRFKCSSTQWEKKGGTITWSSPSYRLKEKQKCRQVSIIKVAKNEAAANIFISKNKKEKEELISDTKKTRKRQAITTDMQGNQEKKNQKEQGKQENKGVKSRQQSEDARKD